MYEGKEALNAFDVCTLLGKATVVSGEGLLLGNKVVELKINREKILETTTIDDYNRLRQLVEEEGRSLAFFPSDIDWGVVKGLFSNSLSARLKSKVDPKGENGILVI